MKQGWESSLVWSAVGLCVLLFLAGCGGGDGGGDGGTTEGTAPTPTTRQFQSIIIEKELEKP